MVEKKRKTYINGGKKANFILFAYIHLFSLFLLSPFFSPPIVLNISPTHQTYDEKRTDIHGGEGGGGGGCDGEGERTKDSLSHITTHQTQDRGRDTPSIDSFVLLVWFSSSSSPRRCPLHVLFFDEIAAIRPSAKREQGEHDQKDQQRHAQEQREDASGVFQRRDVEISHCSRVGQLSMKPPPIRSAKTPTNESTILTTFASTPTNITKTTTTTVTKTTKLLTIIWTC